VHTRDQPSTVIYKGLDYIITNTND